MRKKRLGQPDTRTIGRQPPDPAENAWGAALQSPSTASFAMSKDGETARVVVNRESSAARELRYANEQMKALGGILESGKCKVSVDKDGTIRISSEQKDNYQAKLTEAKLNLRNELRRREEDMAACLEEIKKIQDKILEGDCDVVETKEDWARLMMVAQNHKREIRRLKDGTREVVITHGRERTTWILKKTQEMTNQLQERIQPKLIVQYLSTPNFALGELTHSDRQYRAATLEEVKKHFDTVWGQLSSKGLPLLHDFKTQNTCFHINGKYITDGQKTGGYWESQTAHGTVYQKGDTIAARKKVPRPTAEGLVLKSDSTRRVVPGYIHIFIERMGGPLSPEPQSLPIDAPGTPRAAGAGAGAAAASRESKR